MMKKDQRRAEEELHDPRIRKVLYTLAGMLKRRLPTGWGFALFLAHYQAPAGDDRRGCFHMSNLPTDELHSLLAAYLANEQAEFERSKTTVKRQLMAEQWSEFARKVLPPNCGPMQRQEMRRAFYAGAEAILFRVIQSFAPEDEPTEADLRTMQDLNDELKEFARAVKEGRA